MGVESPYAGRSMLEIALIRAKAFPIFPLQPGGKRPLVKDWAKVATKDPEQIREWWAANPDANIGLPTGQVSGVFVVDVDKKRAEKDKKAVDGFKLLRKLEEELGVELPKGGPVIRTPRGGEHLYFVMTPELVVASSKAGVFGDGVDWRGDNGFVVAPGSRSWEPAGEWVTHSSGPMLRLPGAWVERFARGKSKGKKAAPSSMIVGEGQRNSWLTSQAGILKKRGLTDEQLATRIRELNVERCSPPLPTDEVDALLRSAEGWQAGPGATLTDLGNLSRFVESYGDRFRYCSDLGVWLEWERVVWREVDDATVGRAAQDLIEAMREKAAETDGRHAEDMLKHVQASSSAGRITAMVKLAQDRLAIRASALDSDPSLLNVGRGTLDLTEGVPVVRDANPLDYLTARAPVQGGKTSACPNWLAHLERVLPDDELRAYFHRAMGSLLQGGQRDKCIYVVWGPGDSGKSVTMNAITNVLGPEYVKSSPVAAFRDSGAGNTPLLARLRGARLVLLPEIDARYLEGETVKRWTGGDCVTATPKYGKPFEFQPLGKLVFVGNERPVFGAEDSALWERVRLVPFVESIPKDEQDPEILRTFDPEGIFAWMVEGWEAWNENGLQMPQRLIQDRDEYRDDVDTLADFFDRCTEPKQGAFTMSADLQRASLHWAHDVGAKPPAPQVLARAASVRGFVRRRRGRGSMRGFENLALTKIGRLYGSVTEAPSPAP